MSKENINLPKTSFSMKANLPNREPEILKIWSKLDLYKKLRESRKGCEKFVLHDGPPYANGHIHMGTALNKILKLSTFASSNISFFFDTFLILFIFEEVFFITFLVLFNAIFFTTFLTFFG